MSPDIDERNFPILAHDGVGLPLSATNISGLNSKEKSNTDSPSITNNTTASTTVTSRYYPMAYNTGYGDMCFGRIIERRPSESADSDSLGNNVLFIELDGFTRSGPFPFLKLPLEIRLKIYLYLLGPFHSSDGKSKATHIQIQVERFCGPFDYKGHITGTYEDYLQRLSHVPAFGENISQTPEESGCYTISCDPYLSERSATKDWSMVQLVRDMSNVSRQIRTEFSVAFWTRVSIICPEEFDFAELPNVLNDRPMACAGIKFLTFDVNIQDCSEDELSKFFDAVTQQLNLDGLTLSLCPNFLAF
ncbi:hypothetical protein BKA61DRAFT_684545 [Leptodontidium sp. MPI-SDFR-AT-0119]|nr:hypothetical protein BKA61DRAFT_684545 [Leptodontidium sp. MPI-SDFR-AT-0119]